VAAHEQQTNANIVQLAPTPKGSHSPTQGGCRYLRVPSAGLCNAFGVRTGLVVGSSPRVRCATLGWVVQPLRGKERAEHDLFSF